MVEYLSVTVEEDLRRIKSQIAHLLDKNEKEVLTDAQLPIAAFDLDKEARCRKTAEIEKECERLSRKLEEEIAHRNRIACYLREQFVNSLANRPRSIGAILSEATVENYPLTSINKEHANDLQWKRFSLDTRELFSGDFDLACHSGNIEIMKESEKSKMLPSYLNPYRGGYVSAIEINTVIEARERNNKELFNDVFEDARFWKQNEIRKMNQRIERLRYCVDELKSINELITNNRDSPGGSIGSTETEVDFRKEALDRMMNGVLELRWEDKVKKSIPKPACLIDNQKNNRSGYTEEEFLRIIESYEAKVRAHRVDRETYKTKLESEIEEIKDDLRVSVKAVDRKLADLGRKKVETERFILRDKLNRLLGIARHRRIARTKRQISEYHQRTMLPVVNEAERLQKDCDRLEGTLLELNSRYDRLRKREMLLEEDFRRELEGTEKKVQPTILEYLIRQYRKRPRPDRIARCSSILHLNEIGKCLVVRDSEPTLNLPKEYRDFIEALDRLDNIPDSLPSLIDSSCWRIMCTFRRLKLEADIKVKSCAIEIAETKDALSSCRQRRDLARDNASHCERNLRDLDKSLIDLRDDVEISVVLKTGQLEIQREGSLLDLQGAVLIHREEFERVNGAIVEAGERKLAVLRECLELQNQIDQEEWRHGCTIIVVEQLREDLREVKRAKVTRHIRDSLSVVRLPEQSSDQNVSQPIRKCQELLQREKDCLKQLEKEGRQWKKKTAKLVEQISEVEAEMQRMNFTGCTFRCQQALGCHNRIMKIIARRSTLLTKVRRNFEELETLRASLELLKLRTYPTLNFQP